jgi:uncharacterized protein involved in cysteine biosynthesis
MKYQLINWLIMLLIFTFLLSLSYCETKEKIHKQKFRIERTCKSKSKRYYYAIGKNTNNKIQFQNR